MTTRVWRLAVAITILSVQPVYSAGYLGAQLAAPTPEELLGLDGGIAIVAVFPESPAAAAGLVGGDLIVRVDEREVKDPLAFSQSIRELEPGSPLDVRLIRNGRVRNVSVELGESPWQHAEQPDPAQLPVRIDADVAYVAGADTSEQQRLDLVYPVLSDQHARFPVMLWIHGGGWSTGDRANERALALRFAERGIAVAAVSHRLSAGRWVDASLPDTGVRHPEHVRDVARAVAWLAENIAERGGNPDALFVSGHSSGGHLAALVASDARYLAEHDLPLSTIAGALPIGGAYDIPGYSSYLAARMEPNVARAHIHSVFGMHEDGWLDASPNRYLADSDVPMLVIVEDQPAFQHYAQALRDSADAAKRSDIEFLEANDRLHSNVILMMTRRAEDTVRSAMIEFMDRLS